MTSSSAPPTAPASEPFRFTDAARLHARRFNKHPLASALRLLSADQRITHPDGGIALLTEAGHATRATTLFAATYVPSFLAMLYGFTIGSIPLIALTVPAMLVSALVLGSRCERQMRARRTFDTAGHPWVLSDVAAEPHLGIGNQLLAEVVSRAEDASADAEAFLPGGERAHAALARRFSEGVVELPIVERRDAGGAFIKSFEHADVLGRSHVQDVARLGA